MSLPRAIEELAEQISSSSIDRNRKRPLQASCGAAQASFRRGNLTAGINQLTALRSKIAAEIAPRDADLARRWDAFIQYLITAAVR
jgi:hypothetical protein